MSTNVSETPLSRSIEHGSLILNSVFVRRLPKQRLFRTAVRLSVVDVIVIGISVIIFTLLGLSLAQLLVLIPGVGSSRRLEVMMILGLFFAFIGVLVGRYISKFSPYAKTSGEGLTEWFRVQKEQRYRWVDKMIGRKHFSKFSTTWVDGAPSPVECKVYLGSAPVPRSPIPKGFVGENVRLVLVPRNVSINWVYRERRRQKAFQIQDEKRRKRMKKAAK